MREDRPMIQQSHERCNNAPLEKAEHTVFCASLHTIYTEKGSRVYDILHPHIILYIQWQSSIVLFRINDSPLSRIVDNNEKKWQEPVDGVLYSVCACVYTHIGVSVVCGDLAAAAAAFACSRVFFF